MKGLVKSKDNMGYIPEDNLRVPSGASYPMIARDHFQNLDIPEDAPVDSGVFFMHTDPLTYANTAVFKLIAEELV